MVSASYIRTDMNSSVLLPATSLPTLIPEKGAGGDVAHLFTDNNTPISESVFKELANDFKESGRQMVGVPYAMLDRRATVREVEVYLEKQMGVYISDKDDPMDVASMRRYALDRQIELLDAMATISAHPPGVKWIDHIATPAMVTKIDALAVKLGVRPGPDPVLHKRRHMLCLQVQQRMDAEKKGLIEKSSVMLPRYKKLRKAMQSLLEQYKEKLERELEKDKFKEVKSATARRNFKRRQKVRLAREVAAMEKHKKFIEEMKQHLADEYKAGDLDILRQSITGIAHGIDPFHETKEEEENGENNDDDDDDASVGRLFGNDDDDE